MHFSLTAADNHFGATSAAPIELLDRSWSNTFTSPQTTDLEVYMPSISASVKATDTLTFSGVGYYRRYKNRVVDGNLTEIEGCDPPQPSRRRPIHCASTTTSKSSTSTATAIDADIAPEFRLGSIERLATNSESYGGVVEAQEKAKVFGLNNLFLAGVSYDHGSSNYKTGSELGVIQPGYVVTGTGVFVGGVDHDPDEGDELAPRNLLSKNTYVGLYFSNALDLTDQLTVTVGGRYNHATIQLEDKTGLFPNLNATNKYERFNPMAGANYMLLPGLSVYGGYSESNRAPTPAELGCAEPENPCLIESFLTDDPPLEQVVGRTVEAGLRGQGSNGPDRFTWSAGLFRTLASDDILPITEDNRIFFVNAGNTLRQGVELEATYETRTWQVYGILCLRRCHARQVHQSRRHGPMRVPQRGRPPARHSAASLQGGRRVLGDVRVEGRHRPRRRYQLAVLPQRGRQRRRPCQLRARRLEHVLRREQERPALRSREEPLQLEVRPLRHVLRGGRRE